MKNLFLLVFLSVFGLNTSFSQTCSELQQMGEVCGEFSQGCINDVMSLTPELRTCYLRGVGIGIQRRQPELPGGNGDGSSSATLYPGESWSTYNGRKCSLIDQINNFFKNGILDCPQ